MTETQANKQPGNAQEYKHTARLTGDYGTCRLFQIKHRHRMTDLQYTERPIDRQRGSSNTQICKQTDRQLDKHKEDI